MPTSAYGFISLTTKVLNNVLRKYVSITQLITELKGCSFIEFLGSLMIDEKNSIGAIDSFDRNNSVIFDDMIITRQQQMWTFGYNSTFNG